MKTFARGIIISLDETQGRVSLYGNGVHEFDPSCGSDLHRGDTVEVTFEDGKVVALKEDVPTQQELLTSLTTEEYEAIPRLTPEQIQAALQRGAEERERERCWARGPVLEPKPSLERRIEVLEQQVAELMKARQFDRPLVPPRPEFLTPEQAEFFKKEVTIVDDDEGF